LKLRESNIQKLKQGIYDVLIIGSGINGAVSAAALSGKGARVAIIDQRDFAGFTSQQSSNLAWGGIKYLESHDYSLVRETLFEPQSPDSPLSVTSSGNPVFFPPSTKVSAFTRCSYGQAPGCTGCSATVLQKFHGCF
jgi:2-polyprenyl-6-methoxyphenol hydroxylase-like FAD-dependent oxidoreductase